jgi:hypothetical protein
VSQTDEELFAAYRATQFWVDGRLESPKVYQRFRLRVGQVSEALNHLLAKEGFTCWAYLTACNPGSNRLRGRENDERMRSLEEDILRGGYTFSRGEGIGTDGSWPPEASLLVLGIAETAALELGEKYGQKAILVGSLGEPARLVAVAH